jgi:hypothetical protein
VFTEPLPSYTRYTCINFPNFTEFESPATTFLSLILGIKVPQSFFFVRKLRNSYRTGGSWGEADITTRLHVPPCSPSRMPCSSAPEAYISAFVPIVAPKQEKVMVREKNTLRWTVEVSYMAPQCISDYHKSCIDIMHCSDTCAFAPAVLRFYL